MPIVETGRCPNCGKGHRTVTLGQCIDRSMSEKTLQERVIGRAKRRGWKVAHAGRAWVGDRETGQFITPMAKGWPDLIMFRRGSKHPVIVMELKAEAGTVDEEQMEWLRLMNDCGIPAVIVRPSDLREGRVNAILVDR